LRAEKFDQAKQKGYRLANLISSRALTWNNLVLGENCLIGGNTNIDAYVELGDNVHIAGSCTVGHHTVIQDHCFLAAGVVVSGSVIIEPYCFLGAGSVIRDRVKLATSCVIGAGAVILEDTVANGVYLGRQAELLPIKSDQIPIA
jgi:sugar O-acyltransferase (sialic acid O-acetyltransferase NeuD family)